MVEDGDVLCFTSTFVHMVAQQAPDVGSTLEQRCPLTLDQRYENGWI